MADDFLIERTGKMFYLSGWLNENADLSELDDAGAAEKSLELNMQGLLGMNSTGTAKFLKVMKALRDAPIALVECPRWFVDMANVIPDTLGKPPQADRIKSVFAPFKCDDCAVAAEHLVPMKNVKLSRNGVEVPQQRCHACSGRMRISVDPQDYFLFLVDA